MRFVEEEGMIATGIVRRIDDLGRVVIPKEIRRKLKIREGDPLELFMTNDSVNFKKYSYMGDFKDCIERCCKALTSMGVSNALEKMTKSMSVTNLSPFSTRLIK
jgi:AbrB family transcriptional regulator (stage V sporulation protein T)